MRKLPENFSTLREEILIDIEGVEGYLSPREIRFLALLAAYPTAEGEVLEIGSFKGKSTIVLAKAANLFEKTTINAVDPLIAPCETDPDLKGNASSFPDFQRNIKAQGVESNVTLHQMYSSTLAKDWVEPLRLLWIDGDHTYKGTKLDFDGFAPHLSDGAIIAIHDVLHEFEGGIRVFMEDILLSPNFGACGMVGSIAWAQFHADDSKGFGFREEKIDLYRRLAKLIPYVVFRKELKGLEKKKYKILRSRVPHGGIEPEQWIEKISRNG